MRTVVVLLIGLLAILLACKQESGGSPAASASAPVPSEQNDPRFTLRFGIPKSAEDPEIASFPDRFTPGFVAYKLSTTLEQFPITRIRNTLYALDGGERQQITRSESDISGDKNVFYKSWKLPEDGTYEVHIEDAETGKLVARGRFRIEK